VETNTNTSTPAIVHKNAPEFGPSSGDNNVLFGEMPNIDTLRADYIAKFDSLLNVRIDSMTRNELAIVRGVSNGSIKTAQRDSGKCAYDILTGATIARNVITEAKAISFLNTMSEAALAKLIASVRKA
jgi:hypothetical protein